MAHIPPYPLEAGAMTRLPRIVKTIVPKSQTNDILPTQRTHIVRQLELVEAEMGRLNKLFNELRSAVLQDCD